VIRIQTIGAKALYFLFAWLISAAAAAWLADRKGYGERVGLTFGLLLAVLGLLVMVFLPGRPGSAWKVQGWLPRRRHPGGGPASSLSAEGEDVVGVADHRGVVRGADHGLAVLVSGRRQQGRDRPGVGLVLPGGRLVDDQQPPRPGQRPG
jgi:MFS family permease